tara:strand:- start:57766 stop:58620 length:855 start_codon:yes stop_codon:yes gene_type:complete
VSSKKHHRQIKLFILLGGLLWAWWSLPVLAKVFLNDSFFEFQAPTWTVASHLKDLQSYWNLKSRSRTELIETGRDLARLNAAYEISLQKARTLEDELTRLEALLKLPPIPEYRYEVARVCRRDLSAWWQQILVRKGKKHGIREGAPVVFAGGIVGRVHRVYTYTSLVELVSSPNFRISAHLEGDHRPVTYQGSINPTFSSPRGEAREIPPDIKDAQEEAIRIVSSSLGGTFPEGLTIGYVQQLEPGTDGIFQRTAVNLDQRLLSLTEVAILIPLETEEELTDAI